MKNSKYLLLGLAAVVCAVVLGRAYTYKYRAQDTVVVTGLGLSLIHISEPTRRP